MRSKDGAILTILPPIVYNLKINKSKTRKVFTFKGIQSLKGVTHLRETLIFGFGRGAQVVKTSPFWK